MTKELETFFKKVNKNPKLLDQFEKTKSLKDVYKIASSISGGYSLEEFKNTILISENQLQSEDLENITGGLQLIKTIPLIASMTLITTGSAIGILKLTSKANLNSPNKSIVHSIKNKSQNHSKKQKDKNLVNKFLSKHKT